MKRRTAALRVWLMAMVCVTVLSGCRDNGLPNRNLPLAEAQQREFRYQVYEPGQNSPALAMGGRHWVRSLPVETVPARMLVQVGTVDGTQLFALRGEEAPYSRLYSPVSQNRWSPYLRLN